MEKAGQDDLLKKSSWKIHHDVISTQLTPNPANAKLQLS
jgi:hypothetical protein